MKRFETKYGYFDEESNEYVIVRPDTPRPWVNVICPGDYGIIVSQTGGGYSWRTHASRNRVTRWDQDLIRDDWGKYVFVRDEESLDIWSLTWKPVCRKPEVYTVAHGIGYSRFVSKNAGIRSEMTFVVPKGEPVELWIVSITNESQRRRRLSLFSYLEWCLGVAHDSHREFHKTFIETSYDPELETIWASKRLWEIPNSKSQHWNRSWEYVAFHSTSEPVIAYDGDKESFLGMYGSLQSPKAVVQGRLGNCVGKWGDAVASVQCAIVLEPGQTRTLVYVVGAIEQDRIADAGKLIARYKSVSAAEQSLARTRQAWNELLSTVEVHTPDQAFDLMTNVWLKYQAISGRIWGRTGYYQPGGAYGFRDQLQDSQVFLVIAPEKTKEQIKLHASRQFRSGRVNHWWDPITGIGVENGVSDNLLWLPFLVISYLKETLDFGALEEPVPYLDGDAESLYLHCVRAINHSLGRRSQRGLPLIGSGDWNDGMNAVGPEGRGESIWLGHFLYGILREFAYIADRVGDEESRSRYFSAARELKDAINRLGWGGRWYIRATCDDGTVIGGVASEHARIFLNAQAWAIINEIADEARAGKVMLAMKEYLFTEHGPLLFYPAYREPDEKIGYLTRYAPGVRENGGVYTHAGLWGVLAAAKMKDAFEAWRMYRRLCPVYRGQEPDSYKAEPYVTPGNIDGPDSPHCGRGGWTWYTGSAAWMLRVSLEWLLGVRPEYGGLRIDPCIPPEWEGFAVRRPFRGAVYDIRVANPNHVSSGVSRVMVDGKEAGSNLLPVFGDGEVHRVEVTLG